MPNKKRDYIAILKSWAQEEYVERYAFYVWVFVGGLVFFTLLKIPPEVFGAIFYFQPQGYHSLGQPVLFTLGEAVSAFGLIFAVYQLKNPSWDIVLRIRERWESNLFWYLGIAGLVSVGVSAIINHMPNSWLPHPFNTPLFYELVGFLFFIAAPSALFMLSRRQAGLFNKKRAERFYQILLMEIARPKDDHLEACINIIGNNLPEITKAARILRIRTPRNEEKDTTPPTADEIFAGYADAVLTVILSDERIARYIATARLDFLLSLLYWLKKNDVSERQTSLGIERIFEMLFQDNRSHLYNQLDFRGMTLSSNIFEAIFADPYMMASFSPFRGASRLTGIDYGDEGFVKVYLKALETAVNGYWKQKCDYGMVNEINSGFYQLQEYFRWLGEKKRASLVNFDMFFGNTYVWDYREALKNNLVNEFEKTSASINHFNKSVNAAYAECLYHYLEGLSSIDDKDDLMRTDALTSTTELIGVTCHPNDDLESIRKILISLVWEKIDTGMASNADGYFPPLLRTYISLVGFQVGDSTTVSAIERNRLIDFLETKIKPKILAGEMMKDGKTSFEKAFLPSNVVLNRTTGKFEYGMSGGGHQVMEKMSPATATTVIAATA